MGDILYGTKKQDEFFQIIGNPPNFNTDCFVKLFAYTKKDGIRFHTDDLIKIGPAESKFVKPNTITRLGIYIINKFIIEKLEIFGYINKTFDADLNKKIDKAISAALKAGDIAQEVVCDYIDRCQYLYGGPLAHIINTSMSYNILSLPPKAKKLREDLLKENKKELDANNPIVATDIAKKVVTVALDEMKTKDDPAVALFDSGCGIDAYNNYRTMFVMKGAIQDNTETSSTGYKVITSNYNEGLSQEDMVKIGDALVTSAYTKGVATQDSGTATKQLNAVFQRVRLQSKGSDCGTKQTILVHLDDNNINSYLYRYIIEGGRTIMLSPDTIQKYKDKTVHMRSPLCCKAKDPEYCSICVGDNPYRVGIKNVGLAFNIMRGATMNLQMKSFHDVTVKYSEISDKDLTRYL